MGDDFGDGRSRYEEMPSAHHDHLIDLQTGRVIEFRNEEIEKLLAAAATRAAANQRRYDYTPFMTVAAKAGLRLGEGLGLDWTDCELVKGAGALNVRKQWTRLRELAPPKAGSRRRVPIAMR